MSETATALLHPTGQDAAWTDHVSRTARFYSQLVQLHGDDPRACDYGSVESQRRKFEVMADALPQRPIRLLDVGCGLAHFAAFLATQRNDVAYVGVDICPDMVAEARRLHPQLELHEMDVLIESPPGRFDVVTANGIFYLLQSDPVERMRHLIRRLYDLSDYAVAFTSLSDRAPVHAPGEFYADPVETIAFCQTLTPYIILRHDYLPHDFSVYLFREQLR